MVLDIDCDLDGKGCDGLVEACRANQAPGTDNIGEEVDFDYAGHEQRTARGNGKMVGGLPARKQAHRCELVWRRQLNASTAAMITPSSDNRVTQPSIAGLTRPRPTALVISARTMTATSAIFTQNHMFIPSMPP